MEGVPEAGGEYNAQGVTNRPGVNPSVPVARYRVMCSFRVRLACSIPQSRPSRPIASGSAPGRQSWPPSAPTAARWLRAQLKGAPPALAGAQLRPSAEILAQGLKLRHELEEAKKSGSRAGPGEARPVPQAHLHGRGDRALPAGHDHRAPVRGAPHAVLDQPLCRLGGQAVRWPGSPAASSARPSGRTCSAGSPTCCSRWRAIRRCCCIWTTTSRSARIRTAARARERRQAPRKIGINENLAREIMELHTLGVRQRLHAGRRHELCRGHHRLVDRR